jgi:pimeloyl-ACP methyl ester carboxylesterase
MTHFLTVDDNRYEIRWHRYGKKNGPVLVFLHEGLGCVDLWKTFPENLAEETACDGFVFSRLGYGRSDPCPLPWKINFMHTQALAALPRILSAAGIRNAILIGHSDGGSIALIHAGSRHAGQRLQGVITESAHVFCEPITLASIRTARHAYLAGNLQARLARYHGTNTDTAFHGWNGAWLNPRFVHWDIRKYLGQIQVPVLALQGEDDPYGTPAQLTAVESGVLDCKTVLIKNCRHSPHLEQPDRVTADMAAFIRQIIKT